MNSGPRCIPLSLSRRVISLVSCIPIRTHGKSVLLTTCIDSAHHKPLQPLTASVGGLTSLGKRRSFYKEKSGKVNNAFDPSEPPSSLSAAIGNEKAGVETIKSANPEDGEPERAMWGNQIEFLMSCIATSVGLGNVWRFPFVAYQNGGGAFLIPYIIVLILIGKPMYYIEGVLGQFSSRNTVKVWALAPAMKGIGYAQSLACTYILSYYVSIIGLCLYYLAMSFQSPLPWAVCEPDWLHCVPSGQTENVVLTNDSRSSADLYFVKTVLQQPDGIEGGLGLPLWYLTLCLLASWFVIFVIVSRGVKSSGKASYFLALFPYVVMIILLISTVILPGAGNGILFFITPQWNKLIELDVWYAAVTQVFFSLSVCTGPIIMFSSYNGFRQNVYRDAMIVTTLDTFTSLLSGFTIFGILGNLAHVLGRNVTDVVGSGGTGLAFVSYPDAIAKTFQPQLFAVLFFLMMAVLGVGSAVALLSSVNTLLLDAFPRVRTVYMSALSCTVGFGIGLVYVTPAGQYVLEIVDYYGGTFLILFCGIAEILAVFWIYGLENICTDIEFMLGISTSIYWRFCWGIITPAMMIVVFIYALFSFDNLLFAGHYVYPTAGYVAGYLMLFVGIAFVPIFVILAMHKNRSGNFVETLKKAFRQKSSWGPRSASTRREWELFSQDMQTKRLKMYTSWPRHIWRSLSGGYQRALRNNIGTEIPMKNGERVNAAFDVSPENIDKLHETVKIDKKKTKIVQERPKWGNQIEFLMSCISTSVGLGNVWRFPFVAYQNGGGAFLIPYIIVLIVIGKPMYYLETVLGQFSNSNCVKVWALSPAMKGTGYAQTLGAIYLVSYYVSIIALCFYYLAMSFQDPLPWAVCEPEWKDCVPSGESVNISAIQGNPVSSAELYFSKTVLRRSDGIHDGIGIPLWDLTLCLLISWIIIFLIVARSVKSSGKAAYFLALFPYVVMFILLIRAVTLPGAVNGILFFITPVWSKILEVRVWYAAITQVFFSLSVCSGTLIMFSSYNGFKQNVYRDSMIVTTLDTFTSLISGITIFGVLGNLAYELNVDDINKVLGSGGTSLAFVSYPDAIAKSPFVPQLFAVLFFLMMATLGIGSGVALLSVINSVLLDAFPRVPTHFMSAGVCSAIFLMGLVYVTPGGQYVLEIVDHYGGTFMRLFSAIAETVAIFWIYGLENLCLDIQYMLGFKTSFFWRVCWAIVTPVLMITVFFYAMITTERILFGNKYEYPEGAYIAGQVLQYVGMALVPLFMALALWKYRTGDIIETIKSAFRKKPTYGPSDPVLLEEWKAFRRQAKHDRIHQQRNWIHHVGIILFKGYRATGNSAK
ncbi:uncharacterized protein LOC123872079 [Maniola jurtina]|uniref:uncharacterized protein LOC123872079 n=1 Tax=Maniola jurtina TaxID=191418 RepID=UPI001E68CEC0|nr:uncharacterized protein LOC123872079 [Maniola jurtina]